MMKAKNTAVAPIEMVSLGERLVYMLILRIGFAVVVVSMARFAPTLIGSQIDKVRVLTGAYLLVSLAMEGLRRIGRGRGLFLVGGMLIIDGLYLAWVTYATGGPTSTLRFLVFMHLIAVTLLASYRTGLKIALWHSLLFFVVFYAQLAEIIDPMIVIKGTAKAASAEFNRLSVFNVLAFWVVAIGTTACSAVNERELRRRKEDLEGLAEMAAELENVTEPQAVAEVLLEKIGDAFGFKRGVILGVRDERLSLMASLGEVGTAQVGSEIDPIIRRAWDGHSLLPLKKLDEDTAPLLSVLLPAARNVIIVPLFAEGKPVGILAVEYAVTSSARIERRVLSMVGQFASHAALALRNAWLLEQVWKMAETDPLTGIANRRVFEASLERELARAARSGEQVSLLMLDIDHFKKLNDTHGHQTGDEVLRQVAATLTQSCRGFDTLARYGGEEFAIILPTCPSRESLWIADRMRYLVSEMDKLMPITVSVGVATFPSHAGDPDSLVKAADEALYEAKRAGRNRVTRSRRRPASAEAADDADVETELEL